MADSSIAITPGAGSNVDTRTNAGGDHRQVVVIGDPSATDGVAVVQASDPASNAEGVVVRDVHTSAIAARLAGTIGVYIDQTQGTLQVALKPGTIAVSLDPGYTLGAISGIGSSIQVHLVGTSGTLHTYLDPGTTLEGIQSSVAVHLLSTAGTTAVRVGQIDGSVAVYFSPSNPSVNATFSSTSMEVVPTTGSRKMVDDAHAAQRVLIVGSQTAASLQISGITETIGVHLVGTAGTLQVALDPGTTLEGIQSSVGVHLVGTGGTIHTYLDPGTTLEGIQSSVAVHLVGTGGTVHVALKPGAIAVLADNQHTASIFTVSGSTSGGTTSGVTLVAPSASYNFKVFAYSLQTTSTVSDAWRFTNGAGTETELWRPLVTPASTTSETRGANVAVAPPSFLFATGTSTTLALKSSSGSLVHYSVSLIKESA